MNKKGFTLVELLSVIAILALLVIIALPNIMKIFSNSKKSLFVVESKSVFKTIEDDFVKSSLKGENKLSYSSKNDGNLLTNKKYDYIASLNNKGKIINLKIKNDSFCLQIEDSDGIDIADLDSDIVSSNLEACDIDYYDNGEVIYFNPVTASVCSNYVVENSYSEYNGVTQTEEGQTGCLKWYTFNDNGITYSLILDHNLQENTSYISYTDYFAAGGTRWDNYGQSVNNIYGPISAMNSLEYSTEDWNVNPRMLNYSDLEKIVGSIRASAIFTSEYYSFFNYNAQTSIPCYEEGSGCDVTYGWLFDRTSSDCETYGCLNNNVGSLNETNGFWIYDVPPLESNDKAYYIKYKGFLSAGPVEGERHCYGPFRGVSGIRPVIDLNK